MINQVERTIQAHNLLQEGEGVIVAVSGGPDSVALLKILRELSSRYQLTLKVAHLNHGLRGDESDREETFVRTLSDSMGLPFASRKVDIRRAMKAGGSSLEDACRKERYEYLEEMRLKEGFQKTAMGHHLDDQAETVLMRFLRGSGTEGLKGMLPMRGTVIRPLIEVSRRDIIDFLESEGMIYMKDSSNEQEMCLRNRIRHGLMPDLLTHYNPQLVENLGRTAEICRLEDDYLRTVVENLLDKWGVAGKEADAAIPLKEFLPLHEALKARVIKSILLNYSPGKQGIGYRHVKAVLGIAGGRDPGALLNLPFRTGVRREYDVLHFERKGRSEAPGEDTADYCYDVEIPGEVEIREAGCRMTFHYADRKEVFLDSPQTVFMDCEGIDFPLTVRNRRPGDRIEPLGLSGTKKVKEIFIDRKVVKAKRRSIPLVVDRSSVLWIAGIRLSERVRITGSTNRVLKIEMD